MPTTIPRSVTRPRALAAATAAATLVIAATLLLAPAASAGIGTYAGDVTSGTININTDSASPTVITTLPGHLDATIDDTAGTLSATATFQPTYTPSFPFFSFQLYAKAVITQVGPADGTYSAGNVAVPLTAKLAVTIYQQAGATQQPATDTPLTSAGCEVNVSFDFAGTLDEATGVLTVADPQFTIPTFPAACGAAQGEINTRLAGADNSINLVFGGTYTTTTTSTPNTSTTTTTAPTTTSTTSTTSTTTSTTAPSTSTTTSTTAPTSTSTSSTSTSTTSTTAPTTSTTSTTSTTTLPTSTSTTSTTTSTLPGSTTSTTSGPGSTSTTSEPRPATIPSSIPKPNATTTTAPAPTTTTAPPVTPTTAAPNDTTTTVVAVPVDPPAADDIPQIQVVQGGSAEVAGEGCTPGAVVEVTLDGDGRTIGSAPADDQGDFVVTITIPADLAVGEHRATATCAGPDGRVRSAIASFGGRESVGGVVRQYVRLLVTAPAGAPAGGGTSTSPTGSTPALARTGSENGPLVAIGLLAVTFGAAFTYGSRRIRSAR